MKKIQEHLGLVFLIIIAIFAVAIGGYFTLRKGVFNVLQYIHHP